MSRADEGTLAGAAGLIRVAPPAADSGNVLKRAPLRAADALLAVALVVIAVLSACALVPQWIAPWLATDMDSAAILQPPGATGAHWLGTDQFGRDVCSLVVYGARHSLMIGLLAALIGCGVGVAIGLTAGYAGGLVDMLLMRFIDVWMAIPNVLLAIALATALGPSLHSIIVAVSVVYVPRYARIVRAETLSLRAQAFIEAARAAGASHFSIVRRHLLPHCSASIVVLLTIGVGHSILLGTVLSFVGLGVDDERPDWGYQLMQGRGYLSVAPWAVTYPGLAIAALVISVNLVGEALQRRLDPRRSERR